MSSTNPNEAEMATKSSSKPSNAPDVENQNENQNQNQTSAHSQSGYNVVGILRRWNHEDMSKKGWLGLRGSAFVFSFLAFIIMASNRHGDWRDYNNYQEFRYELAIAILSSLYTGLQAWRQYHQISNGKEMLSFSDENLMVMDFVGDQIMAYLLISAASAAVPMTNRMREGVDNAFTDSLAASISMEFFAFFVLGSSAVLSGYKLIKKTYV